MLKAILFDMDGVIVDSEPMWLESKQLILKEFGIDIDVSYHYNYFGTSLEHMWTDMKKDFDLPLTVSECIQKGECLRKELTTKNGYRPIPGAIDLIKTFSEQAFLLAVASSSPMNDIQKVVETFDIRRYFDVLATGEDFQKSKPSPDIFLGTAEALNVSPHECLVIEDSINGVSAAKSAGMKCIGFENPNFNVPSLTEADLVVSALSEIRPEDCFRLAEKN